MKKTLVVATDNKHKVMEIEGIMKEFGFSIVTKSQAGVEDLKVEETGDTFEENSMKKARVIMEAVNMATLADDSGLEVDCLDGAPGVYSARFAGVDGDDKANNRKLIDLLKDTDPDQRQGRFVSVITLIYPDGESIVARGEVEGRIILEERGSEGFGYDPLFVPDGYEETFGQLRGDIKNRISHRANALSKLREILHEEKIF